MKRLQNFKKDILIWTHEHRYEAILLGIILVVASFMRLYRIADYMTFLGDEGRDVIIVRRFLTELHPMLIGPGTSIGNMYLGPLYYYLIAPSLLLANFSPVGPAVFIALMGIATVWLVWAIARDWFGQAAGLIAAFLYAIAPVTIIYSRSSWNPNIMPFFALIAIYSMWKVWKSHQYRLIAISAVSFAACLQSHYLALLLLPTIGFYWALTLFKLYKAGDTKKSFFVWTVIGGILFLLLMSPLAFFDIRHEYRNFNAIKLFFTERQTTVSIRPWTALPLVVPQLTKISTRLIGGYDARVGQFVVVATLVALASGLMKAAFWKKKIQVEALILIAVWLGVSLIGFGIYKQEIYDHYYGFVFPIPFILIGALAGVAWEHSKIRGRWIALTLVVILTWVNLSVSPLKYAPNGQLNRSITVTDFIMEDAKTTPFNFAVIAERNYEGAYRYFFNKDNAPVLDINPQDTKNTIAPVLYVVCEMEPAKCDPTHNAKAEVANFGWSTIETQWTVSGTTVYKLVHSIPSK